MTDPSTRPLERAKRYRELAAQAKCDAEASPGAIRDGYLILERGWLQLAGDVEAKRSMDDGEQLKVQRQAALRPPTKSTE